LRRSGKEDTYIYTHEIRFIKNNERIVKKRQITPREFISLQESQGCSPIVPLQKIRISFIYLRQYFMIEQFLNVENKPSLLRIETTKGEKEIRIPPFL